MNPLNSKWEPPWLRPPETKKELYLAKDMVALNASANTQTTDVNPQSLALSALKFLTIASSGFSKRDEDRAYVYYMHILNLVASIKRTADFWSNPKFYKDALGIHNIKDSLEKVEILSKSLISR